MTTLNQLSKSFHKLQDAIESDVASGVEARPRALHKFAVDNSLTPELITDIVKGEWPDNKGGAAARRSDARAWMSPGATAFSFDAIAAKAASFNEAYAKAGKPKNYANRLKAVASYANKNAALPSATHMKTEATKASGGGVKSWDKRVEALSPDNLLLVAAGLARACEKLSGNTDDLQTAIASLGLKPKVAAVVDAPESQVDLSTLLGGLDSKGREALAALLLQK